MEIISRKQAKESGLNTYFTGKECINGHLNYRYVASGACYDCIRANRAADSNVESPTSVKRNARLSQMREAQVRQNDLNANFPRRRFRMYESDRGNFAAAAWGFAALRLPTIALTDVDPGLLPRDRQVGTMLCEMRCHPDDYTALLAVANSMLGAHSLQAQAARQAALNRALRAADDAASPEPPEARGGLYQ